MWRGRLVTLSVKKAEEQLQRLNGYIISKSDENRTLESVLEKNKFLISSYLDKKLEIKKMLKEKRLKHPRNIKKINRLLKL